MIQEPENIDFLMEEDSDIELVPKDDGSVVEALVSIDLDDIDNNAQYRSEIITDSLSNYYFDEKYLKDHPYIPTKIMQEMDNVRRLYKMLMVNEKAQDALIKAIAINAAKGTLFISLTSMQKATLMIQKQLNDLILGLEATFQKMQDEADKMYAEKDKETGDDGSLTIRGAREFIKTIQDQMNRRKMKDETIVDIRTGEVINEKVVQKVEEAADIAKKISRQDYNSDGTPIGATPLSDIIG